MALPLTVYSASPDGRTEQPAQTRDISFRGLYFLTGAAFELGTKIEFVLTLPKEITQVGDVYIRCFGEVVRVEPLNSGRGIAARIQRYEFLPGPTSSSPRSDVSSKTQ